MEPPTDLDADPDADADVDIDEGPSNSSSNKDTSIHPYDVGVGASSSALHREDAEMSDGSISNAVPTTRSPAPAAHSPAHSPASAPAPITVGGGSTRLIPITERELRPSMDRDREAGGETEVEPDSVGQLSLSSRRAARGGGGGAGAGGSRTRFVSSATAAAACTEDEGMSGPGGGVEEVDEVEMGDAIE